MTPYICFMMWFLKWLHLLVGQHLFLSWSLEMWSAWKCVLFAPTCIGSCGSHGSWMLASCPDSQMTQSYVLQSGAPNHQERGSWSAPSTKREQLSSPCFGETPPPHHKHEQSWANVDSFYKCNYYRCLINISSFKPNIASHFMYNMCNQKPGKIYNNVR